MSSKQYFDAVANRWDQMRTAFFSDTLRETALGVAQVQPKRLAADIGAGTGFVTEALLEHNLSVIAVDQSEEMLQVMRQRFSGVANIDYRVGRAEALPIDDTSVDYVFANMYLHHVEAPPQAIAEMARILKPGGKLIITDMDEHNYEWLRTEQHDRWLGFQREAIHRWFEEARLEGVSVELVGEQCSSESINSDEFAEINVFIAVGEKAR